MHAHRQSLEAQMHADRRHFDGRLNDVAAHLDATHRSFEAFRADATRFSDRVEKTGGAGASFILQDSLRRLEDASASMAPRIAVVSVLPPMETGIANYTLAAFEASDVPVDVFAPFPDAGAYLGAVHRLPRPGGPLTIHALETLSFALATRHYKAVVWVLGNSHHHLPVLRLLRDTRHLDPTVPNWVQLHDPVLLNLARLHAGQIGMDPATLLRPAAGPEIADANWDAVAHSDFRSIDAYGGLAARALLVDLPLDGLILHSRAAREVLLSGWPDLDRLRQRQLFLPALDPFVPRLHEPKAGLRIGSFGFLGGASKGIETILAAFRELRRSWPDATFVIAGYSAERYAQQHGLVGAPGVEIHDNPPLPALLALMDSVDVAVQLRMHNSGESSGIVPQLLSRDVPTLVSMIGAFAEYGEAVRGMPVGCGADELIPAILEEAQHPERRRSARRCYVETRRPADFCAALFDETRAVTQPEFQRA